MAKPSPAASPREDLLNAYFAYENASNGVNTSVCDGHGGLRVHLQVFPDAKRQECLSTCITEHERSHIRQLQALAPDVCAGKADNVMPKSKSPDFIKAGEVRAYSVEVNCLEEQAKKNDDCRPLVERRLNQVKAVRDCMEKHTAEEVFNGACKQP